MAQLGAAGLVLGRSLCNSSGAFCNCSRRPERRRVQGSVSLPLGLGVHHVREWSALSVYALGEDQFRAGARWRPPPARVELSAMPDRLPGVSTHKVAAEFWGAGGNPDGSYGERPNERRPGRAYPSLAVRRSAREIGCRGLRRDRGRKTRAAPHRHGVPPGRGW
jgi:hypothetical protein